MPALQCKGFFQKSALKSTALECYEKTLKFCVFSLAFLFHWVIMTVNRGALFVR